MCVQACLRCMILFYVDLSLLLVCAELFWMFFCITNSNHINALGFCCWAKDDGIIPFLLSVSSICLIIFSFVILIAVFDLLGSNSDAIACAVRTCKSINLCGKIIYMFYYWILHSLAFLYFDMQIWK